MSQDAPLKNLRKLLESNSLKKIQTWLSVAVMLFFLPTLRPLNTPLIFPLTTGISREELRERFFSRAPNSHFQFVLKNLAGEERIQASHSIVSRYGRHVTLNSEQEKLKQDILQLHLKRGLQPPTLDELLKKFPQDTRYLRDLYYFLLQQGELVRVSEDVVVAAKQITSLKARLTDSFPSGNTFSVPEFKDLFKISRKYAIPFLEYLDRVKVTQRLGDQRVLRG